MKKLSVLPVLLALVLLATGTLSATARSARAHAKVGRVHESPRAAAKMSRLQHGRRSATAPVVAGARRRGRRGASAKNIIVASHGRRQVRWAEHFSAPSFAENVDNLTLGDVSAGEDPIVRASLIQALGNMNGTALAIDPKTGRLLAMVNQKLALGPGAEPCSTIKLSVALAALSEGLIKQDTPVNIGGHYSLDLTHALAKSVNPFFEVLGRQLGFERVKHYANELGLGELAGYNVRGEQLGTYPSEELPKSQGGVGRMCSFGEGISMTPMQLGAIVSAIANGGTLYYLQHPTTPEEIANFSPKVKRQLNIGPIIPEILPGMAGAVNFSNGTGRSVRANFSEFPVMGKTGTCSNNGTRYGWFGSFADTPNGRIVAVFFLTGGRPTFGPKAAELSGMFYRALADRSYFLRASNTTVPATTPAIGPGQQ
ncbi:penicillin-binding transpeptidase domain-containing protein [Terriglobus saanensis]|uniref:beta-lactamase n=1 Tax=Terriglobus saanensis (strain ATCC BAA-1853 / DSM 23119 / SP1PR4) TaxID=401053 RepID=E8V7Q9_TERSS|nr:penicillin-binding transpeptidase domain-containing protein [Terriglobus saanensis]ADV81757.1 penicillin-binding protein transpeptidase [Terriglobus saanensis SP1PR4]